MVRSIRTIILFILSSWCLILNSQPGEAVSKPLNIGETVTFFSNELGENRSINVYLPHGYDEVDSIDYSVIYLLDGSIDEDFLHIAGLVQFGSFSWINMVPPSIVIGIANVDRKRDFTYPSSDERDLKGLPTSGGSSVFINYLEKELKPYINSQYRVNDRTTLIGQSLGGLCATEILITRPDMFNNYIIVSPSLWWDNESMLKRDIPAVREDQSIFIAVGKEGTTMERVARQLHEKFSFHNSCYFEFLEDKDHGDALHEAAYHAFEKIYNLPD